MYKYLIKLSQYGLALILILGFIILTSSKKQRDQRITGDNYGKGFYNHSKCLYVYMSGGTFDMMTADGSQVNENLTTNSLTFHRNKTHCLDEANEGKVSFTYKLNGDHKIESITINMNIYSNLRQSIWGINKMSMIVMRENRRKKTFQLVVERDIYAGSDFSYSCNELELETVWKSQPDSNETNIGEPHGRLILKRFQLQPFSESTDHIFNDSFDCSTWFSIPTLLGFLLFLFLLSLGLYPTYLLANIDPGDFRFTKQGQQFTQYQSEAPKQN